MDMIKALLFDLDGTLIHTSEEYRYSILEKTLGELGTSASKKDMDKFWFKSGRDRLITNNFQVDSDEFWEIFQKYDYIDAKKNFIKPYEDVNFIKEMKKAGFKIGVVTGAKESIAFLELGLIGIENFDSVIAAGYSDIKHKPDPEGINLCLSQLKINNKEAVYVGNSEEDIFAARNAEVLDFLIDRKECKFPNLHPSFKINSLYELKNYIF
ncbi:MAG: HAD family hydrolase [Nanoarchaeota archaeon]|nr:HAD family hydrolase [Nanoarchaeota archaeon]